MHERAITKGSKCMRTSVLQSWEVGNGHATEDPVCILHYRYGFYGFNELLRARCLRGPTNFVVYRAMTLT